MRVFRLATLAVVGVAWLSMAAPASAEDTTVVRRLTQHGKLSKGEAKRLVTKVTKRMGKSAGMTNNDQDPLRMAASRALFGVPVPPDRMGQAKVRLRLYAGLNQWALDAIFKPRPGVLAECTGSMGVSQGDCEALVAAAGRVSLADARKLGGGTAVASSGGFGGQRRFGGASSGSRFKGGGAASSGSRFQRFDSGFRGGSGGSRFGARPQGSFGSRSTAATRAPAPRARNFGARPAPRPAARPAPPPRPNYDAKAEYKKRRAAYLARQKARMEKRKEKVVATAGGTDKADRGPTSAEEAEVVGLAAPSENKARKKPEPAAKEAAVAEPAAPAEPPAPKKKPKPQLDEGFLNDLLADPLGN